MSRVIRRIGPLMFWQFVMCTAGLPFYFVTAWLTLKNTWPDRLLASAMILAIMAAIAVFRYPILAFIDRVALVEPDGEPPRNARALRLWRHTDVYLFGCLMCVVIALHASRDMVASSGVIVGLLAYLIAWHLCLFLPILLWVRSRDAEQLPPKRGTTAAGIAEFWIVPPGEDDEDGLVIVAVNVDGIRSLEEVVVAVLGRQVLPALNGGKRRWSVVVDGVSVGELTQSWQHPRWWPPIDWNASPSALFKGGQVTFRPVDGPR
jgi:hypothetical protein